MDHVLKKCVVGTLSTTAAAAAAAAASTFTSLGATATFPAAATSSSPLALLCLGRFLQFPVHIVSKVQRPSKIIFLDPPSAPTSTSLVPASSVWAHR